jgi:phosphonate transport system substrate-binding protein
MISRRHFGLVSAAAGLAACEPLDRSAGGGPGQVNFSILPTGQNGAVAQSWRSIVTDLASATGLKAKLLIPRSYAELVESMRRRLIDAGLFSNETGLEAVRRAGGEVFARTVGADGADGYQSVLIVKAGGAVTLKRILKCDRSLRLGLGDPLSTSGYVAPVAYFFGDKDLQPRRCFRSVSVGGDNLRAIAGGSLDVAASNTLALALDGASGGHDADKVETIWSSPLLPQDPMVWRRRLDPALKETLRQFFLTYGQGETPQAQRQRDNLKPLLIGGFAPADDTHLLPVREADAREKWVLARWSGDEAEAARAKAALDEIASQRETLEARIRAQAGTQ